MEHFEGNVVVVIPPENVSLRTDGPVHRTRTRPPWWRRRRTLLLGLGLLLLAAIVLAVTRPQSPPPLPAPQASAPLIAHGQIVPAQQARVGTQGGGVVQRLDTTPGTPVTSQTPLAWLTGPSGTEVVTAPFDGVVTNVLVHAGDTLMPGAPIGVVADLHTLQVETSDVDEFLVNRVSVGQRVQISVDALDNRSLSGTVASVALLPQTGTSGGPAYPVVIQIGGLPPDVRPGMSVRVTFPET